MQTAIERIDVVPESGGPAISWGAVFAGAAAAMAITLILLTLGNGLGLSMMSPWSDEGASATTLTVGAVVWLVVTQWLSSGLGGYMAGRLRIKWSDLNADEVTFRDTSHGFLAWAVATVAMAVIVASIAATAIGVTAQVAGSAAKGGFMGGMYGATQGDTEGQPSAYLLDSMFRPAPVAAADNTANSDVESSDAAAPQSATAQRQDRRSMPRFHRGPMDRAETAAILVKGLADGDVSEEDRAYLASLVANRTGLDDTAARARVDSTIEAVKAQEVELREAADTARKTAATTALLTALALAIGAFIAAVAGALGGWQRDEY